MERKGIGQLLKLAALLVYVVAFALLLWSNSFTAEQTWEFLFGGLALYTAGDLV